MNKLVNKGSIGCTLGLAIMCAAIVLAGIIFLKCYGLAFRPDYTLAEYIRALFSRHALTWYLGTGFLFTFGLWLTINAIIAILKDFFEI